MDINMYENEVIIILDDELPNVFHVVTTKIGELGIIFIPDNMNKYCFKQTNLNNYLKTYHLITILHELNIKNGCVKNDRNERDIPIL